MAPVRETNSAPSQLTYEQMDKKIREIIKSNGIDHEVSEVVVEDSGLKGEGFCSETFCVTVHFKDSIVKPQKLFVKTETSNPSHSKFLEDTKLFEKESVFLTKYVPAARNFCEKFGQGELLNIYPKCYFGDKKLIVLENLVQERGFELLDKAALQDLDTAKMALTTLAKHHAISKALMLELGGPEAFFQTFPSLEFKPYKTEAVRKMMDSLMEASIQTNIEVLNRSSAAGKEEAVQLLQEKAGKAWDFLLGTMDVDPDDPFLVLNHGDFWNNNMMFLRNKETGKLVDHVTIDLQAVQYDSPAFDIGYYLYSSVKAEVRQNRLEELLNHYIQAFNVVAAKLECPVNMTYDGQYGLWFCGTMMSTRAAYLAINEFDVSKSDMTEFGPAVCNYVLKWAEENPKECEEDSVGIVKLMMEYKSLRL